VKHRTRAWLQGPRRRRQDSGIIRQVETTPANEPNVAIAPAIIPDHLKTPLTFSLDATDRACQSQTPGPSRRYRLQSQTRLAHAKSKHFGTMALTSPAVLIESGFAGGQAKMATRLCAIVPDCDWRSSRPAVP
jgi:hypothetical protein